MLIPKTESYQNVKSKERIQIMAKLILTGVDGNLGGTAADIY